MNPLRSILLFVIAVFLSSCGGGSSGSGQSEIDRLAGATSVLCPELTGLEGIYWDFINGSIRPDLPSTAFSIPFQVDFTQTPYSNSTSLLLGFTSVPLGWTISDGADVSGFAIPGTVAAANMGRNDNQAFWRYVLNAQLSGGYSSAAMLNAEINTALNFLGNPPITQEQCQFGGQQQGIIGIESVAIKVVRTANFTIMARAHIVIPDGLNGIGYYDGFLSLSPTDENPELIYDIYIPMITQLYGGGSTASQCEDGLDNDGDGKVDLADPQCEGPFDDSEAT